MARPKKSLRNKLKSMTKMFSKLPDWAKPLFKPNRYKSLFGGRGSAKSYTVAKVLLILGTINVETVLCAREFQSSIADSVHRLLRDQIEEMGLSHFYKVTNNSIRGKNGTVFIFKGVRNNVQSVKSTQGVTKLWIEEGQTISKNSWEVLIPTIREPGSEIWITWNPENADDPTYTKFVNPDGTPQEREGLFCAKINHSHNPWFPEELKKEMEWMREVDPDLAEHIWEGGCRINSDAQIFNKKWAIRDFEINPNWDGPYFGADFGFSQDPSTLIKIYIDRENMNLMISHEAWDKGVDLDDMPAMYDTIEGSRTTLIRGDCSRPETISHLASKRFAIIAAKKWTGSVEDGITFIRGFKKVIIHSRCTHTAVEFKKYSYKVDKLTGDVTTTIVDDWNHCIDAIRYALEPIIGNGGLGLLDVL